MTLSLTFLILYTPSLVRSDEQGRANVVYTDMMLCKIFTTCKYVFSLILWVCTGYLSWKSHYQLYGQTSWSIWHVNTHPTHPLPWQLQRPWSFLNPSVLWPAGEPKADLSGVAWAGREWCYPSSNIKTGAGCQHSTAGSDSDVQALTGAFSEDLLQACAVGKDGFGKP